MRVLWLDDDSPRRSLDIGFVEIITARSCMEAWETLITSDSEIDWIIVDLIVPQAGWGGPDYLEKPGLAFIDAVLSHDRTKGVGAVVYSIVTTPEDSASALAKGARAVFDKSRISLLEVVSELFLLQTRTIQEARAKGDIESRLRDLIEELQARLVVSPLALTAEELEKLHTARLALEDSNEQRLRSYEMLAGIRERVRKATCLRVSAPLVDYDVFLSYKTADRPSVRRIAEQLVQNDIKPWLDVWALRPGDRWQEVLGALLDSIACAAVFVGREGTGPWQDLEVAALLERFASRECRIVPVLLEGVSEPPKLPAFLSASVWVDFRQTDPDPLRQLCWGIKGG